MPGGTFNTNINVAGVAITGAVSYTDEGGMAIEIPVPAGAAGTLTTRTDNETGTLTMASGGHGITTGAIIDLFWSGGSRHGILVGTVSGTSVPIGADNSGTGDNLPSTSTALVASVQKAFNCAIDGDELALLGIKMLYASNTETAESYVSLLDAANDVIAALTLNPNRPRNWDIRGGDTNTFAGDPITDGVVTNGSSTNAATLQLVWLVDATP